MALKYYFNFYALGSVISSFDYMFCSFQYSCNFKFVVGEGIMVSSEKMRCSWLLIFKK